MPVGEAHALRRELVDVRCGDPAALGVVALHVAVAEVVGVEDEDVGLGIGGEQCRERQKQQSGEEGGFHTSVGAINAGRCQSWPGKGAFAWQNILALERAHAHEGRALRSAHGD